MVLRKIHYFFKKIFLVIISTTLLVTGFPIVNGFAAEKSPSLYFTRYPRLSDDIVYDGNFHELILDKGDVGGLGTTDGYQNGYFCDFYCNDSATDPTLTKNGYIIIKDGNQNYSARVGTVGMGIYSEQSYNNTIDHSYGVDVGEYHIWAIPYEVDRNGVYLKGSECDPVHVGSVKIEPARLKIEAVFDTPPVFEPIHDNGLTEYLEAVPKIPSSYKFLDCSHVHEYISGPPQHLVREYPDVSDEFEFGVDYTFEYLGTDANLYDIRDTSVNKIAKSRLGWAGENELFFKIIEHEGNPFDNYYVAEPEQIVKYTVQKKELIPILSQSNFEYDGRPKTPTIIGFENGSPGDYSPARTTSPYFPRDYTLEYENNVEIGQATVKVNQTLQTMMLNGHPTSTYSWISNYSVKDATFIISMPVNLEESPEIKPGVEYDGTSHKMCTSGVPIDAIIEYAVTDSKDTNPGNDDWSSQIPERVNAGTYHVWFRLVTDSVAKYSVPVYVGEFKIAKKDITVSLIENSYSYTGNPVTPSVEFSGLVEPDVFEEGDYELNCNNNIEEGVNTAKVLVLLANNEKTNNYHITNSLLSFSIISHTTDPVALSDLTYNGTEQELITPGLITAGHYEYALGTNGTTAPGADKWSANVPTAKNAGDYYVWYRINDNPHFSPETKTYIGNVITISKLNIAPMAGLDLSFDYDGTEHKISSIDTFYQTTTTSIGPEIVSDIPDELAVGVDYQITSVPDMNYVNAGLKQVSVTLLDTTTAKNYLIDDDKKIIPYEIKTIEITPVLDHDTYVYSAEVKTPVIDHWDGMVEGETLESGVDYDLEYVNNNKNAGDKAINIVSKNTDKIKNYSFDTSLSFTITKAPLTPKYEKAAKYTGNGVSPDELIWEGYLDSEPLIGPDTTPDGDFGYFRHSNVNISEGQAYTEFWLKNTERASNYYLTTDKAYFSIVKGDLSYYAPTIKSGLRFKFDEKELIYPGSAPNGNMQYALGVDGETVPNESKWSTAIPKGKNAGDYYVWYRIKSTNPNFNDLEPKYIGNVVNIAKLEILATDNGKHTYSGGVQIPNIVSFGYDVGDNQYINMPEAYRLYEETDYVISPLENGDYKSAGEKFLPITLLDTEKANNFTIKDGGSKYTIGKANVSPVLKEPTHIYDGKVPNIEIDHWNGIKSKDKLVNGIDYILFTGTGDQSSVGEKQIYLSVIGATEDDYSTIQNNYSLELLDDYPQQKSKIIYYEVVPRTITPILDNNVFKYDGSAKKPTIANWDNIVPGESLQEGVDYTISYSNNSAVGDNTAAVIVTFIENDKTKNYVLSTDTINFSIRDGVPTLITTPSVVSAELSYTGVNQEIIVRGETNDGVIYYAISDSGSIAPTEGWYTTNLPTAKDAGTYYVWYKVDGNDGDYDDIDPTCVGSVVVKKADIVANIEKDSYEYTGSAIKPTVSFSGFQNEEIFLPSDYNVDYGANVNVGSESGVIAISLKDNARTKNYNLTNNVIKFSITKSNPVVTAPTIISPLSYNRGEQVIINAGSTNGGTMEYALGSSSTSVPASAAWSSDLLKASDIGSYYIWYRVVGNENVFDYAPTYLGTATIGKRTITPTFGFEKDNVYTGEAHEPFVQSWSGAGLLTGDVLVAGEDYTITYENNVYASSSWNQPKAKITLKNTAKTSSYQLSSSEFDFTISPRTIHITGLDPDYDYAYDGNPKLPLPIFENIAKYNGLDIPFVKDENYTIEYQNNVEKGTNTAKAILHFSDNKITRSFAILSGDLEDVTVDSSFVVSGTIRFSVTNPRVQITGLAIDDDSVYTGLPQQIASYSGSTGGKVYFGLGESEVISPGSGLSNWLETSSFKVTNAGVYYVWYRAEATDAGRANVSPSFLGKVLIDNAQLTPVANPSTFEYSSTNQVNPEINFEGLVNGETLSSTEYYVQYPAYKVGSCEAIVALTNVGAAKNYHLTSNTVTYTIEKGTPTISIPDDLDVNLTYNGQEQELLNSQVEAEGGIVFYALGDGYSSLEDISEGWSSSIPKAKNAGEHKVFYRVIGDANHKDVDGGSITININKREINVSLASFESAYTGQEIKPGVNINNLCDGESFEENVDYTVSYNNNINAGNGATVTVNLKDTEKANNYHLAENELSFTIDKRLLHTSLDTDFNFVYDGNPKQPDVKFSHESDEEADSWIMGLMNGEEFTKGVDYQLSYENNTEVYISAIDNENTPFVAVELLNTPKANNYKFPSIVDYGKIYFRIYAEDFINNVEFKTTLKYTGHPQELIEQPLFMQISDYNYFFTVTQTKADINSMPTSYLFNFDSANALPKGTNAGTYYVYYIAVNSIDGTKSNVTYLGETTIAPADITPSLSVNVFPYTGGEIKPTNISFSGLVNGETLSASDYSLDYYNNINMGSAKVIISLNNTNYHLTNDEIFFTIGNAPTVNNLSTITTTYSAVEQNLITSPTVSGGQIYYAIGEDGLTEPASDAWSTSVPARTDAGSYHIWYKVDSDADHVDIYPKYLGVSTIKQLSLSVSFVKNTNIFAYSGEAIEPEIEFRSGIMSLDLQREIDYSVSYSENGNVNAGEVTLNINLINPNIAINKNKLDFEIVPIDCTIENLGVVSSLTYDGDYHDLVTTPTFDGCEIYYILGEDSTTVPNIASDDWSKNVPRVKDAGTYYVWYRVDADNNHISLPTRFLGEVVISGVEITATLEKTSYEYTGSEIKPAILFSASDHNINLVSGTDYTIEYSNNTNIGTASVTITLLNESYSLINSELTFAITKKHQSITNPTAKDLTYNGDSQSLVNGGIISHGSFYYSLGTNSTNPGTSFSLSIPTGKEAGTYYVWYYSISSDSKYDGDTLPQCVEVVIKKKSISVSMTGTMLKTGSVVHPAVNITSSLTSTSITSLREGVDYHFVPIQGNMKDVGDHKVQLVLDNNNYELVGSDVFYYTIVDFDITEGLTASDSYIYTGGNIGLINFKGYVVGGGTIHFATTNSATTPPSDSSEYRIYAITRKEVGVYHVWYVITGNGAGGYTVETAQPHYYGAIEIKKRPLNVFYQNRVNALDEIREFEYTGKDIEPGQNMKIAYSVGTINIPETPSYLLNEGTDYTISYENNKNVSSELATMHINVSSETDKHYTVPSEVKFAIVQKQITPVLDTTTFIYDGTEKKPNVSFTGLVNDETLTEGVDYEVTYENNISASDTFPKVIVTLKDTAKANNYKLSQNVIPFKISKSDPIVNNLSTLSLTYNGSVQKLISTPTVSGGTISYYVSSTNGETTTPMDTWISEIPMAKVAGDYSISYKVAGSLNYNAIESTLLGTTTIAPIQITASLENDTVQINGANINETYNTVKFKMGDIPISLIEGTDYELSYENNTTPGTATVHINILNNNYFLEQTDYTFTVVKGNAAPFFSIIDSLTYNGTSQVIISGDDIMSDRDSGYYFAFGTDATQVPETESETWWQWQSSSDLPKVKSPGTYYLWYRFDGNDSLYGVTAYIGKTVVSKAGISVSSAEESYVYTGSPIIPDVVFTGLAESDSLVEGTDYTIDCFNNLSFGTATVIVTLSNPNYSLNNNVFTFKVRKANPVVTPPTPISGVEYNRGAKSIFNPGSTTFGTLKYALGQSATSAPAEGAEWTTDVPKVTEPGTYYLWYRVIGNDTIFDISPTFGSSGELLKKRINWSLPPVDNSFYYGGSIDPVAKFTGLLSGDQLTKGVDYDLTVGEENFIIYYGTYLITCDVEIELHDTNITKYYRIGSSDPQGLTILPISVNIEDIYIDPEELLPTGSPLNPGITLYNVNHGVFSLDEYEEGVDYTIEYSGDRTNPGDTGTITFTKLSNKLKTVMKTEIAVDGVKIPVDSFEIPFTVRDYLPILSDFSVESLSYSGVVQNLVTTPTVEHGTINYAIGNDGVTEPTVWSEDIPTATNAGTYHIWYKLTGGDDYVDIEYLGEATISPVDITVSLVSDSFGYTGSAVIPQVTFTGLVNGEEFTLGTDYTIDCSNSIEIGDVASATVTLINTTKTNNYNLIGDNEFTFTITKQIPVVTAPTSIYGVEYNRTPQKLFNPGTTTVGTLQYALGESTTTAPSGDTAWSAVIPEVTEIGTYYLWYRVVGGDTISDVSPTFAVSNDMLKRMLHWNMSAGSKMYDGRSPIDGMTISFENLFEGDELVKDVDYKIWYERLDENLGPADWGGGTVRLALLDTLNTIYYRVHDEEGKPLTIYKAGGNYRVKLDPNNDYAATGSPLEPNVLIVSETGYILSENLQKGVDYFVTYSGNRTNPGDTGTATVTLSEKVRNNLYMDLNPSSVGFTVTYSHPSISGLSTKLLEYTGTNQKLVTTPIVENADVYYAIGSDNETAPTSGWYTDIPLATKVGTYHVWYKILPWDPLTYSSTNPTYLGEATISPVEITVSLANDSYDFTGSAITPQFTFTGLVNGESLTLGTDYTVTGTNNIGVGTNAKATVTLLNDNYILTGNKTFTFSIIQATIAPTEKEGLEYSGEEIALVNPGSSSDGTFEYAFGENGTTAPTTGWSSNIPKKKEVGSYHVWYRLFGGGEVLEPATYIGLISIDKRLLKWELNYDRKQYDGINPVDNAFKEFTNLVDGDELVEGVDYDLSYQRSDKGPADAGNVFVVLTLHNTEKTKNYRVHAFEAKNVTIQTSTSYYHVELDPNNDYAATGSPLEPNVLIVSDTGYILSEHLQKGVDYTVTYTGERTNPGDECIAAVLFTDEFIGKGNLLYTNLNPTSVNFTVDYPHPSISELSTKSLEYTGVAQNLVTNPTVVGATVYYAIGEDNETTPTNWSTTIPTAKNVGTYHIWYKLVGLDGSIDIEYFGDTTISPVEITVSLASNSYQYTGSAITPQFTFTGLVNGESLTLDTDYIVIGTNNTAVGTDASAKVILSNTNYTLTGNTTFTFAIVPNFTAPTKKEGLEYCREELELINAGYSSDGITDGTFEYAIGENGTTAPTTGWSTDIPKKKDIGSYHVWYRVFNGEELARPATYIGEVSIAKILLKTVLKYESKLYDGKPVIASEVFDKFENLLPGDELVEGVDFDVYSQLDEDAIEEGLTFADFGAVFIMVTLYDTEKTQYYRIDSRMGKNGYVMILKAHDKFGIALDPNNDYAATGSPLEPDIIIVSTTSMKLNLGYVLSDYLQKGVDYFVTYSGNRTNQGDTGTATVTLSDRVRNNIHYDLNPSSVNFTVAKPHPSVSGLSTKSLEYTGLAQNLITTPTVVGGTINYAIGSDNETAPTNWSSTIPSATNAGTYHIWYKLTASQSSYSSSNAIYLGETTISPIEVTASLASDSYEYTGSAIEPAVSFNLTLDPSYYAVEYSNNINVGTASATVTLLNTNYSLTGDTTTTFTFEINPVEISVSPAQDSYQFTGSAITPEAVFTGLVNGETFTSGTDYTIEYNNNINKGTASATVTLLNTNYTLTNNTFTFTITKIIPVVTAPTAVEGDLVYDGEVKTLFEPGSTTGGTILYALWKTSASDIPPTSGTTTWSEELPMLTNPGTFHLWYKVVGNDDYADIPETYAATKEINRIDLHWDIDYPDKYSKASERTITKSYDGVHVENDISATFTNLLEGEELVKDVDYEFYYLNDNPELGSADAGSGTLYLFLMSTEKSNHYQVSTDENIRVNINKSNKNYIIDIDPNFDLAPTGYPLEPDIIIYEQNQYPYDNSLEFLSDILEKGVDYFVEYSGPRTNPGDEGTITITIPDRVKNSVRSIKPLKLDFTVSNPHPSVSGLSTKSLDYAGVAQELTTIPTVPNGIIHYTIGENALLIPDEYITENWTDTPPTATNVGTYHIWYYIESSSEAYSSTTPIYLGEATISPADITASLASDSYEYTGSAITPEVTFTGLANGESLTLGTDYTIECSNNIEIGSVASATITLENTAKTKNYNLTGDNEFTFEITKVTPVVTLPTANYLEYDGTSQLLFEPGTTTGGTLQYTLSESETIAPAQDATWSTELPAGTEIGTYYLWYRVIGTDEYFDIPATFGVVGEIHKITLSWWFIEELNYGDPIDSSFHIDNEMEGYELVKGVDYDINFVEERYDLVGIKEYQTKRTYRMVLKDTENANYYTISNPEQDLIINSVTIKKSCIKIDPEELICTGSPLNPEFVLHDENGNIFSLDIFEEDEYSIEYSGDRTNPGDVGYITIEGLSDKFKSTVYFVNDATYGGGGSPWIISLSFVVRDYPPTLSGLSVNTINYSGVTQNLVTTPTVEHGSVYYAIGNDTTTEPSNWSSTIPTAINAGTYHIWYKLTGSEDYDDVIDYLGDAKINQVNITASLVQNSYQYTGSAITPDVTFTGLVNEESLTSGTDYTISCSNNIEIGTANVTVTLLNTNYALTSNELTFSIDYPDPTILSAPTVKDGLTYNGAQQELVVAGSVEYGSFKYALGTDATTAPSGDVWMDSVPTGKNAGTYYVWYKVLKMSGNEYSTEYIGQVVTINKKAINPSLDNGPFDHTGSEIKPNVASWTGLVTGESLIKGTDYKITYSNNIDVGVATAKVELLSSPVANNYVITNENHNFTILAVKVDPFYFAPKFVSPKPDYNDGNPINILIPGESEQGVFEYVVTTEQSDIAPETGWSTSLPLVSEIATYYAWFRLTGNEGYNDVAPTKIGRIRISNTKINYIDYNLNGGEFGSSHPDAVDYGMEFVITHPIRDGYTFKGWDITGMDSSTHTIGDHTSNETSLTGVMATNFNNLYDDKNKIITFTATWEVKTYQLRYSTGYPEVWVIPNAEITYGQTFAGLLPEPTSEIALLCNPNKEFVGWYLNSDLAGAKLTETSVLEIDSMSGITLYARWDDKADYYVTLSSVSSTGEFFAGNIEGLPIGGGVLKETEYTLIAHDNALYTFDHWLIDGEDAPEEEVDGNKLTHIFTKNTYIQAVYNKVSQIGLNLKVVGKKPFSILYNGVTVEATLNTTSSQYEISSVVEPLAPVKLIYSGEGFVGWLNESNMFVSENKEYSTKLAVDTTFTLRTNETIESEIYVEFRSYYGKLFASGTVTDMTSFTNLVPTSELPIIIGKTFDTWKLSDGTAIDAITSENLFEKAGEDRKLIFTASYNENTSDTVTITIKYSINGEILNDEESVTTLTVAKGEVKLLETDPDKFEGKEFISWQEQIGDARYVLSTSKAFYIHAINNRTIYAVYNDTTNHSDYSTVTITGLETEGNYRIWVQSTRSIPTSGGYELLEHGILYSGKDWSSKTDSEKEESLMFTSENSDDGSRTTKTGVYRVIGAHNEMSGGLDAHLNVGSTHVDSTLYVRGYIIVSDHGEVKIIYTDVYQVTYNGLSENQYKRISPSNPTPPPTPPTPGDDDWEEVDEPAF